MMIVSKWVCRAACGWLPIGMWSFTCETGVKWRKTSVDWVVVDYYIVWRCGCDVWTCGFCCSYRQCYWYCLCNCHSYCFQQVGHCLCCGKQQLHHHDHHHYTHFPFTKHFIATAWFCYVGWSSIWEVEATQCVSWVLEYSQDIIEEAFSPDDAGGF